MIYAFLWDEESIIPPFIFDPEANEIGAELIPLVNSFANRFNDFTYYEQNFQVGFVYHPTKCTMNTVRKTIFRMASRSTPATTGVTHCIPIPSGTSSQGSGCWTSSTSWMVSTTSRNLNIEPRKFVGACAFGLAADKGIISMSVENLTTRRAAA